MRWNIFIYYVLTVSTFLFILYYSIVHAKIDNLGLVTVLMLCFVLLSAVFISKLAVDPLAEHIQNLQNLSKETLHELNLPISTIKSNSSMIKKNITEAKTLKRLSRIESACDMLQQRYSELDYMIKMQTRQEINEKLSLDRLVKERVDFLQALYPHITINLELTKLEIINDKIGLSKVIDNLIDNAVKYSQGSTTINVQIEGNELFIEDFGCGMDEVELLQIFDNYYQSNKNMQGFGIGLGMVKRFCDTNKIELRFKSQPQIGTTVILKFKDI